MLEDAKLQRELLLAAPEQPRADAIEDWAPLLQQVGWDPTSHVAEDEE